MDVGEFGDVELGGGGIEVGFVGWEFCYLLTIINMFALG
jgi:hypothetical protein